FLEALLELAVENLAFLSLGLHLLLEALFALGRLRSELIERGTEFRRGALARRLLVRDDSFQGAVDRELVLSARARDDERLIRHGATIHRPARRARPVRLGDAYPR